MIVYEWWAFKYSLRRLQPLNWDTTFVCVVCCIRNSTPHTIWWKLLNRRFFLSIKVCALLKIKKKKKSLCVPVFSESMGGRLWARVLNRSCHPTRWTMYIWARITSRVRLHWVWDSTPVGQAGSVCNFQAHWEGYSEALSWFNKSWHILKNKERKRCTSCDVNIAHVHSTVLTQAIIYPVALLWRTDSLSGTHCSGSSRNCRFQHLLIGKN